MVYVLFGPYMLGVGILGVFYWDKILFNCEGDSKIFSFSNMFNLTACLLIAILITLGVIIYDCCMIYINSIIQRNEGNCIVRKVFWWAVLKFRRPHELT